jgi:hypothetical protein
LKPSGAILLSCSFKFLTFFAEFSKVICLLAYGMQAISMVGASLSYATLFPVFTYVLDISCLCFYKTSNQKGKGYANIAAYKTFILGLF